jgi:hypothetical protein
MSNKKYPFRVNRDKYVSPDAMKPKFGDIKGVEIIELVWVYVSDFMGKTPSITYKRENNKGRKFGAIKEADIKTVRKVMKNGGYEPFHHEPPVLQPDGKLVTGNHRFQGADGVRECLLVAICKFPNKASVSAYAQKENLKKKDYFRVTIDDDTIISTTSEMIQNGELGNDKKSIEEHFKTIGFVKSSYKGITDAILGAVNVLYKRMIYPSLKTMEYSLLKHLDVLVKKPKFKNWLVKTINSKNGKPTGDRVWRIWDDIWKRLAVGEDLDITVSISNCDSKDIDKVRGNITEHYLLDKIDMCCQVADAHRNGTLGSIEWTYPRQVLNDEMEHPLNEIILEKR